MNNRRLVSTIGYIGYTILYGIPLIGLIFVIIHSFAGEYDCRKNFARAFLLLRLISLISIVLVYINNKEVAQNLINAVQGV